MKNGKDKTFVTADILDPVDYDVVRRVKGCIEHTDSDIIGSIVEYGWVCPLCGRVNAPWKATCDCFEEEEEYEFLKGRDR